MIRPRASVSLPANIRSAGILVQIISYLLRKLSARRLVSMWGWFGGVGGGWGGRSRRVICVGWGCRRGVLVSVGGSEGEGSVVVGHAEVGEARCRARYRDSSSSAIWTAFRAAPLRRLSPTRNSAKPTCVRHRGVPPDAAHEGVVAAGGPKWRGQPAASAPAPRRGRPASGPCSRSRASVGLSGRSKVALMDRAWPVKVGTRTHTPSAETARSPIPRILRLSLRRPAAAFCSSSVSPLPSRSPNGDPAADRQHVVGQRRAERAVGRHLGRLRIEGQPRRSLTGRGDLPPVARALTPARPAPEAAWSAAADHRSPGLRLAGRRLRAGERPQHGHRHHGRAVGVGDDALRERRCASWGWR